MPVMNIIEAVRSALQTQMRRDQRVVVLGEDVGKFGGVFRATSGLYDEFGADRVIDTPLAEAGIIGTAIGMALYGLRPVPEIQFADFIFPAFDQIVNELAKFRYRSGGQYPCPVVIRTPVGGGIRGGALPLAVARGAVHPHARPQGRRAVATRTTRRACCSRRSARTIRCCSWSRSASIARPRRGPRGRLRDRARQGEGRARGHAGHGDRVRAAWCRSPTRPRRRPRSGHRSSRSSTCARCCRSTSTRSSRAVKKTGRCVIVHEAPRTCGFGAELIASIQERALEYLEAPILRVTGFDTPFPYTPRARVPAQPPIACSARSARRWSGNHGVRLLAAGHRRRRRRGRDRQVEGQGGRQGQARPAARRGDDRQGDGRDPVAARRHRSRR